MLHQQKEYFLIRKIDVQSWKTKEIFGNSSGNTIRNETKKWIFVFCAIFFLDKIFGFFFTDSADCAVCEEALQNLEDIDDDADAVGVRMVKTDDAEFAQFIGLTEFPSIVYYEHGNPHIYDGKL